MSDKPLPPFLKRGIAIRATELTPMQKLLLYTLNTRADKFGTCFPSIEQLEIDTGLAQRSVIRIMNKLRSLGLVITTRMGDHKQRNIYKLNLVHRQSTVPPGLTIQPGVSSQGLHIRTPDTESLVQVTLETSQVTQSHLYPDTESPVSSLLRRKLKRYIEEEAHTQPNSKRKEEILRLKKWIYVLENIDLPPQTISCWFASCLPVDIVDGTLIVATESEYRLNWCLSHYSDQLSEMNVKLVLQEMLVQN
ncbi:hypothetical protein ES703_79787 [subsurface metagenome]